MIEGTVLVDESTKKMGKASLLLNDGSLRIKTPNLPKTHTFELWHKPASGTAMNVYALLSDPDGYSGVKYTPHNGDYEWIRGRNLDAQQRIGSEVYKPGKRSLTYPHDYRKPFSIERYKKEADAVDWQHLALVIDTNENRLYSNGKLLYSQSNVGAFTDFSDIIISKKGSLAASRYKSRLGYWGHVDEIILSNGAKYTTDFVPSTTPNTSNVLNYISCDELPVEHTA